MKKRLLGSFIAIILIGNGLLPAGFSVVPLACGADAASIQLPLFQLCSSVRSPFRIMNGLMGQSLPLFPGFSSPAHTANTADAAVGSACCLTISGMRTLLRNSPGSPEQGGAPAALSSDRCFSPPDPPLPPGGLLCLFLLVYLVLLSRSNLPWAIRNYGVKFFTQLGRPSWAFLLP